MSREAAKYDASHLRVLEGLEAIRKRPGMYIGSTSERGLRHLVFEVVERAVNEVLAGLASRVDLAFTSDGGVRVVDDGVGISVGEAGDAGVEALLSRMSFGMMPQGRNDVIAGFAGVGLCVVNALSRRLTVEIRRDGARWAQEYARGVAVAPLTKTGPSTTSGTTFVFWPDPEIFDTVEFSFEEVADRFRELAFLNHGLEISLSDQRHSADSQSRRFRFPGGARDFVAYLDDQADSPMAKPGPTDIVSFEQEDATMAGTMEVAFRWHGSSEPQIRSFANSRATPGGGTHERGFRDGVAAAINAYAREQRLLAVTDPDLSADRVAEGLTAVVSVKLDGPEFEGSTRQLLGNTAVRACVGQAVQARLGAWLKERPDQALAIVDKFVQGVRRE